MKIVLFESLIAPDFARVILNWVGFYIMFGMKSICLQ